MSCLLFLAGAVLFLVWALKTLAASQLLAWSLSLVALGFLGVLLTASFPFAGIRWISQQWGSGDGMMDMRLMGRMMEMMEDHDEADPDEDHEGIEDMMHGMMRQWGPDAANDMRRLRERMHTHDRDRKDEVHEEMEEMMRQMMR